MDFPWKIRNVALSKGEQLEAKGIMSFASTGNLCTTNNYINSVV